MLFVWKEINSNQLKWWIKTCVVLSYTSGTCSVRRTINSRYLAQNAAIWLADEVLRYCDHAWHFEVPRRYFLTLDTQQSKRRYVNNGLRIVKEWVHSHSSLQVISVNFIAWFLIDLFVSTNLELQRLREICSGPRHVSWWDNHELDKSYCVLHSSSTHAGPNRFISFVIIASWHWTRTWTKYSKMIFPTECYFETFHSQLCKSCIFQLKVLFHRSGFNYSILGNLKSQCFSWPLFERNYMQRSISKENESFSRNCDLKTTKSKERCRCFYFGKVYF